MSMLLLPGHSSTQVGSSDQLETCDQVTQPRRDVISSINTSPPNLQKAEPQPSVSAPHGSAVNEKMDLLLTPVRVATSKPARQTYLNTILFMISSAILLGAAILAYILFYFNYVPQIGIERPIHLQYGDGPHPYGIASLDSSLVSQQPYDIIVSLNVPRSPPNLAQGNFMLSLSLLPPTYKPPLPISSPPTPKNPGRTISVSPEETIFFSRRPTILTYTSRLISLSERMFALPLYILGLRQESEILHIPMAESQSFLKGWKNIPAYVMIELQAGQAVQVYDVRILFTARFGGLRWLMYNHRILSFIVFTSAFWFSEVVFTALGWLAVRAIFSSKTEDKTELVKGDETDASMAVKAEGEETDEPDLSDTPRTFPTYGRQAPLRFVPKVKDETDSEDYIINETAIQPLIAEADDEDEEDLEVYRGGRTDSGIGTSFSEAAERSGLAKRRSRSGK